MLLLFLLLRLNWFVAAVVVDEADVAVVANDFAVADVAAVDSLLVLVLVAVVSLVLL